jgi:IrrE N-terminal-like domain
LIANPIQPLFKRLRAVGFTRPYVTKVAALPTWWDDSAATNPAGYAQLLLILSRHLGLDLESLQAETAPLRLKDFGQCKYKKRSGTADEELLLSRVIATRAAQLATAATVCPYQLLPAAADIRQTLLELAPWVGFEHLLDFCWATGIPVLHVNVFPRGAKRPEAFTLRTAGRPVVVLCREDRRPSWQLFILAHELGHVALGHVPENGALLDEAVEGNEPDDEEVAADKFAVELLTGSATTRVGTDGRWPNAETLARLASEIGRRNAIDPGHVVLNYAHSMGKNFFGVACAALKKIDPNGDALAIVRSRLAENLDWEQLPEDSSEFLMRMTRQEGDA